jgi:hypothetical protein
MPFVKKECREEGHTPCSVGDLCYNEYKELVKQWKMSPRWTTCHDEFRNLFDCNDVQAAKALAFFVFFDRYVLPYEKLKEEENGTI